ncbi:MAG: hypothetical protein LBT74_04530, partial [Acidobacteriota bacterium]|nr:hypothetical protein [Acidobacteriota bacterium]
RREGGCGANPRRRASASSGGPCASRGVRCKINLVLVLDRRLPGGGEDFWLLSLTDDLSFEGSSVMLRRPAVRAGHGVEPAFGTYGNL